MHTRTEALNHLFSYLQEQGSDPHWDHDHDFWFWHKGCVLWLVMEEEDPEFFHLIMPRLYHTDCHRDDYNSVLYAAMTATAKTKNAKVFEDYSTDEVWASSGHFIQNLDQAVAIMPRALSSIWEAVETFESELIRMKVLPEKDVKDMEVIRPGQVWRYARRVDVREDSRVTILAIDPRYSTPAFKIRIAPFNFTPSDAPGGEASGIVMTISEAALRDSLVKCEGEVAVSEQDAQPSEDLGYFTVTVQQMVAKLIDG